MLSVAHVLGCDWLGATPCQGPAIFIDAEDSKDVLHLRSAAALHYYDAKFADVARTAVRFRIGIG